VTERRVFLSYRREDSIDASFRLYDALANRFGDEHVFIDIDSIDPGQDFEQAINEHIASCDALVVVIGQRWADLMQESQDAQRTAQGRDYVVLEIEAGLQAGLLVIPVLIHGAQAPTPEQVPPTIVALCRRQALECSHRSWSYDVGKLIDAIERCAQPRSEDDPAADLDSGHHRASPTTDGAWEAIVTADREQFERVAVKGIEFPPHHPPRRFVLDRPVMRIGRRRAGSDILPEVDLSGEAEDRAISYVHAILFRQPDGSYSIVDPGSSNGTKIDDDPTPIATDTPVPLVDGARIRIGAWTVLTVRWETGSGSLAEALSN
jgi:hypothetical protein